jgi:hypothetical protein
MAALIPLFRGGWDLPVQKGREPDSNLFGISALDFLSAFP